MEAYLDQAMRSLDEVPEDGPPPVPRPVRGEIRYYRWNGNLIPDVLGQYGVPYDDDTPDP